MGFRTMQRNVRKVLFKPIIIRMLLMLLTLKLIFVSWETTELMVKFSDDHAGQLPVWRDWHDWQAMYIESQRTGIGERGEVATLDNNTDRLLEEKMLKQHGLNALLSDKISVNRSLRDLRDKRCLHKKYLAKLPTVSIVIAFHNEYLSTFARTLHSLINRTPPELLKEIILVDDYSDTEFFRKLELYVAEHFDKVRFVRLPERVGLVQARLAGVHKVTAEVLVIFDAHIEVHHNWLPPLLEPITLNRRTVTCPLIDWILAENLEYTPTEPRQGGFNWRLTFVEINISSKDLMENAEPYKNPVMNGGLFAISVAYFWELGGYDKGLQIWGGEQFDLSFKIWMCGGQMLNVPCSRVGHHFRGNLDKGLNAKNPEYLRKNKKRIADVWMDEYGKYVYEHIDDLDKIDAGDLTEQKALREKLRCKSFKWYINEIAAHLTDYPPTAQLDYAAGAIQSVASPGLCVDTLQSKSPGLFSCAANLKKPHNSQLFLLRWTRDLRWGESIICLEAPEYYKNARVMLHGCHKTGGNQFWYYDRKNKFLMHGLKSTYCLEAVPSNETLRMNICQKDNPNMKWNFGAINETALDNFFF